MAIIDKNISKTRISRDYKGFGFGNVIYQCGGIFGPRKQEDFQIVAVHTGEVHITLDGAKFHVAAGNTILLYPGRREVFEFSRSGETHHSWCNLNPTFVSSELRKRLPPERRVMPLEKVYLVLWQIAMDIVPSESHTLHHFAHQLALTIIENHATLALRDQPSSLALHPAVERARIFIMAHYTEALSLQEISREAGVVSSHLIRIFQKNLGQTPIQYLWEHRLGHAASLLKETGFSLGEIAARTGFQTPYHLSRLFKNWKGTSPRAYRLHLWKGQ